MTGGNNVSTIQDLHPGFTKVKRNYLTTIIKNSDAESICEIGTFVGTNAKYIWDDIKDTGKKLYLVDNYFFLPEHRRKPFFDYVVKTIDPNTKNIIPILADSHVYDWTQHDFIIFQHHSEEHYEKDFQTLMNNDVKYFCLEVSTDIFHWNKRVYELINNKQSKYTPRYFLHGLFVFGHKDIPCDLPIKKGKLFGQEIKYIPEIVGEYLNPVLTMLDKLGTIENK